MKIKELSLQAFGKFKNKNIKFEDGFNIVFGVNESGKSTIFKFIDGILYGFAKNGKQRRNTADFEKFRPWNGQEYKGSMTIEQEDEYRIMRDFDSDDLNFYNLTSGENLGGKKELNSFAKIKQPGAYLFGIDGEAFKNLFFIGQLESKIDSNEVDSLKYYIENFATSGKEKYSVVDAIDLLTKRSEELGKSSRKNSPIGSLNQQIEELKQNRNNLKLQIGNYQENLESYIELRRNLEEQKKFVRNLKLSKEQEDYEKVKKVLNSSKNDEEIGYLDMLELTDLSQSLEHLELELSNYEETKEKIIDEELDSDYEKVKKYTDRLDELNRNNFSREIELLNHDLIITKSEVNKLKMMLIVSILGAAVTIAVAIVTKVYLILILLFPLLVFAYVKLNPYRMKLAAMERIKSRVQDYMKSSMKKTEEKKAMDIDLNNYIKKYGASDVDDLKKKIEDKRFNIHKLNLEVNVRNEFNTNKKLNLQSQINDIKENIKKFEQKYDLTFEDIKRDYLSEEAKLRQEQKHLDENIVKHILNGRDVESLNHGIEIVSGNLVEEELALEQLESRYENISREFYINDEKMHKINEIDEILDSKELELTEIIEKQNAMNKAIGALQNIYKENKKVYLPKIVDFMSDFINEITSGRYKKLTVDEKFNIAVEDSDSGKMIEAQNLSNGTIDQLYLGLRIAISEILYKNAFVILDDHFIQYDDIRLRESLKYLKKYSETRQVILFSAMKREMSLCDELGIKYNKVDL